MRKRSADVALLRWARHHRADSVSVPSAGRATAGDRMLVVPPVDRSKLGGWRVEHETAE
jgi:hypothetical protein